MILSMTEYIPSNGLWICRHSGRTRLFLIRKEVMVREALNIPPNLPLSPEGKRIIKPRVVYLLALYREQMDGSWRGIGEGCKFFKNLTFLVPPEPAPHRFLLRANQAGRLMIRWCGMDWPLSWSELSDPTLIRILRTFG